MKRCSSCGKNKQKSEFYSDKSKSDGVRSNCKSCHNSTVAIRNACPEIANSNAVHHAEWESKNREYRKKYKSKWFQNDVINNPEKYTMKYSSYYRRNKGVVLAKTRKRQIAKICRTPVWVDAIGKLEIDTAYKWCAALRKIGVNAEVDHIIPLQGASVSGLHVPKNLQVIHASDNRKKGNFYAE